MLIKGMMKLNPIYGKMRTILASITASEKQRSEIQVRIDQAEASLWLIDKDADSSFNPFDFLNCWSNEDSVKLMVECKKALKDKPESKGDPDLLDCAVYIDDLIAAFVAPNRVLREGPHRDRDIILAAHRAYEDAGLERSVGKSFGWGAGVPGLRKSS